MNPYVDDISERASKHSEAQGHIQEFTDSKLGPVQNVNDRATLKEHTAEVLESKDTRCFTAFMTERPDRQADHYYHPPSNTLVTVPLNPQHEPTVYRPETFEKHYEKKLEGADRIEKNRTITEKQGVYDLHPEVKRDMDGPAETKEFDKPLASKPFNESQLVTEAKPLETDQPTPTPTPVDDLASSYANANPETEATPEALNEAAYFAHSVEDPEKYPPRDEEMKDRVDERRADEEFEKNYAKATGVSLEENKDQAMQERMDKYMQQQKTYTM